MLKKLCVQGGAAVPGASADGQPGEHEGAVHPGQRGGRSAQPPPGPHPPRPPHLTRRVAWQEQ